MARCTRCDGRGIIEVTGYGYEDALDAELDRAPSGQIARQRAAARTGGITRETCPVCRGNRTVEPAQPRR
jgi:hypothetical protein